MDPPVQIKRQGIIIVNKASEANHSIIETISVEPRVKLKTIILDVTIVTVMIETLGTILRCFSEKTRRTKNQRKIEIF